MDSSLAELPLAIFSTLAPVSAGAFIALALAFFTVRLSEEQLKKIDKMTIIPLIGLVLGFVASLFHLHDIGHVPFVFDDIGRSPLSNEIAVGAVFCVLVFVYCIAAWSGRMSPGTRKAVSAIVAVGALVFSAFCGMAYMMDTIASWDTLWSPLMVVGFCLFGGTLFGSLVLALAGVFEDALKTGFKLAMLATTLVGAVLSLGSMIAFYLMVGGMYNALVYGYDLARDATVPFVIFIVLALGACAIEVVALYRKPSAGLLVVGAVAAVLAIFLARLVFYALQLSVGVSI